MHTSIPDVSNDNIVFFGQRVEPTFAFSIVVGGLGDEEKLKRCFDLTTPVPWLIHSADHNRHVYDLFNLKNELDVFLSAVQDKIRTGGVAYVHTLVSGCEHEGITLVVRAQSIRDAYRSDVTQNTLATMLEEFVKQAKRYCLYYTIAFFERPEFEILQSVIQKYATSQQEAEDLFHMCMTPSKQTDTDKERSAFLALAGTAWVSDKERTITVEEYRATYGWLGVRFFLGRWWKGGDVVDRLATISVGDACALQQEKIQREEELSKQIVTFKKKLTSADIELVDQVRDMIYLRTQRADYFNHASALVLPLIEDTARRLDVSFHDLMYLTPEEVVRALRDVSTAYREDIEARTTDMLAYYGKNTHCVLSGSEATAYVQARPIFNRAIEQVNSVRGVIAYRGKYTGVVRVVFTADDAQKVQLGDVLVTTMTTPNLMSAMDRASAFVTDEGGILCHASIVAREMKKPCIIGTKIATKVLKDGDLVEVDANKGVVRILKRAD